MSVRRISYEKQVVYIGEGGTLWASNGYQLIHSCHTQEFHLQHERFRQDMDPSWGICIDDGSVQTYFDPRERDFHFGCSRFMVVFAAHKERRMVWDDRDRQYEGLWDPNDLEASLYKNERYDYLGEYQR